MSDPVFDTILRNLRAKQQFHESEAAKLTTAIEAIDALSEPVSMKGPSLARGFDSSFIGKKLRHLHIAYPLPPSYCGDSGPANFQRQFVVGHVLTHPRGKEWLLREGIPSLGDAHRNRPKLTEACEFLGIDEVKIRLEARILHKEILEHGTHGIDYLRA